MLFALSISSEDGPKSKYSMGTNKTAYSQLHAESHCHYNHMGLVLKGINSGINKE